jgi:adenylosuccinate lyase
LYLINNILNNIFKENLRILLMDEFETVINKRYKAPLLSKIWSPNNRIKTMRQLWIDLALIQKAHGIDYISEEAIKELINNRDNIDYEQIKMLENKY